jgi:hypothetical protein
LKVWFENKIENKMEFGGLVLLVQIGFENANKKTKRTTPRRMNYQPVKGVIFDLDGLLLDTEPLYQVANQKVCEEYGANYIIEAQLQGLRNITKMFI